jgi:hypothetical protein
MPESDLYLPLKRAFEAHGFTVFAEVNACDLAARRGDELLIVEMKRAFNLELVLQGIERQRATPLVYLAFEAPARYERKRYRGMLRLCRRLGLGLIAVRMRRRNTGRNSPARATQTTDGYPEVLLDPPPPSTKKGPRIDSRRRRLILNEIQNRSGDYNVGGCTRTKIVTAYREAALRIARQLKLNGPSRVCKLAEGAESKKAGSILLNNYYGWFERIGRGVYQLTTDGSAALETYRHVV